MKSRPVAPLAPYRCGRNHEQTIQAEWIRPESIRIRTPNGAVQDSEGHWEVRLLCDKCAAAAIMSEDPPWRMHRIVPDRLVDVLYGPAKRMPRNAIEERKARGG